MTQSSQLPIHPSGLATEHHIDVAVGPGSQRHSHHYLVALCAQGHW